MSTDTTHSESIGVVNIAPDITLIVGTQRVFFRRCNLCPDESFGAIAFLKLQEARRSAVEGGFLANLALYLPGAVSAAVAIAAAVGAVAWLAGR